MNITKKETGDLTAVLTLEITPEDYKEKVDETLRSYKRKASIPGFRPGKVPFGVINKMYGRAALIDEVHKIMSDSIYKYIDENNLEIFGNPILNNDTAKENDWDNAEEFTFDFDIALIPELDPEIDDSMTITRYDIQAEKEDVEKYMGDIRERYGKFDQAEEVAEGQFIYGELIQLNDDKSEKEDGLRKHVSFWVRDCSDDFKKLLLGKKKDEKAEFVMDDHFPDVETKAEFFRITPEEIENAVGPYAVKMVSIMNIIPAELNEELFAKVFPDKKISSEEELRTTIEEDIRGTYNKEAARQFYYEAQDALKEKYPVDVPEEFLKKWLKQNSEKELSDDDIEKGWPSYAKHLHWQVIETRLMKKYEIKVEDGEFRQHVKDLIGMGHVNEEDDPEAKAQIDQVIQSVVQKEEDIKRIYDGIYEQKLTKLFEEKFTIEEKSTTWKEFLNLVQKN
ncbi:MAG: trigger factor [Marinilabiliales bacterium]|nr:MAG: trigger factor [Marinilabiliales bacterium]